MNWTAPGNDGNTGTASSYDIRYSTSEITPENFANATQVTGVPAPQEAGSVETFTVTGLNAVTTYYFAIKTRDGSSNVSDISNVLNVTTAQFIPGGEAEWINLASNMLSYIQGNEHIDLGSLVDEQGLFVTEPEDDNAAPSPLTYWNPSWGTAPVFQLDLGDLYSIDKIAIHDYWGTQNLTVSYWANNQWNELFTWGLTYSDRWRVVDVDVITNSLKFEYAGTGGQIGEIGIKAASSAVDEIAPADITDLSTSNVTSNAVTLNWTAPGNDGNDGTAAAYDIRYSTSLITDENFANATQVTGVPAPQEAGSAETFTLSGLNAATTYYFAIKTADEALNVSDLSTIVSATTPSEPIQSDPYWIPLTKTMFSYHSGNTMISLDSLSDEQHVFVVDPINGQSSPVIENYTDPAWGEPPVFDLDLGRNYAIDMIALFDHWGSAGLTIKYFAVSRWVTLTTWDMSYSERWKVFETSIVTSRLRFEFDGIGAKVGEIGIKGVEDDTPQAPDNIAPSAVTDLTATSISSVSVKLDWTAPGNDDIDGMAAGYDIRYSTEPINAANFENATVVDNSSKPKAFGSLETVTVNNLNPSSIYYFAIKAFDEVMNTSDISNIANVQTHGADFVSRIEITDDMVINEYGWSDNRGSFANLFDEQSHLIEDDPVNIPATHWRVPSVALTDTVGIVIDLGREYEIDRFFWFDGAEMGYNGTDNEIKGGKLIVQTGTPFDWDIQVNEELDNDNVWHSFTTPVTTRFIRIVKLSTQTYMWTTQSGFNADAPLMEMVFYGTPTGDPVPPVVQPPHEPLGLTFDQQVGANAWWYTNTNSYDAVGIVRAYQDWSQSASATETSTCNFKPEFDTQYASTLEGNFEVFPCLQGGIVQGSHNKPPYSADGNTRNPASYALHADHVFQWVARYGHNTSIDPALLRPVEWQRKSPGLGYINYFENWNEQDRWWSGDSAYFNAYQYSAMTSADYDGHMGTMGATYGAKNADTSVKFAMGGTISIEHEFVKAMKFWADHNRGGDFPADVLNFHLYSNDGGGQDAGATMGISPEADHLDEKLRDLVTWCNTNLPGKEVWVSEFGYDVEGDSWQIAKGHTLFGEPGYTAVDLQASWLVRSYIVGAAAGVDRMMVYSIKDASASKRQFATCGLIDFNNNKRPSWYYVKTMKDRLAGMIFEGKKESGNSNVWIYKFRTKGKKTGAYVVWCPTSNGTSVENYTLNFDAVTSTAKLVSLANLEPAGIESNLTVDNNSSVFNVSENPVFILVDNIDDNIVADVTAPSAIDDLSATEITSVSVKLNWSATGNDGAEGRAEGYDIRYSTSEITSENFEQATVVENSLMPLAYGFAESFVVEGLDANTTYYFAIKAFDEESNYAEISNVIEVTTHITPLYISEWLILNNSMLNLVSGSTGMSMNTLVDEQGIFSTEPSDNVEAPLPTSIYDPSWGDPQTIILNLGADYYLDKIAIFDGWGSSGLNVTYYNGEEWVALFSWALTYGNRWKVVDLNIVAGQLKFEFTTTGGKVGEIGLKGYDITTVENRIPVANAGLNQVVNEGVMVSLDGIASSDPDSDEITFLWTAPEGIILNANDVAQPTFTAPQVDEDTQYQFTLVVNDGELDSEPSTVMVTVVNLIPSRPVMYLVSELTIADGEFNCIDAYNTITIAGDGGTVVIEGGASANIVAGKSIRFLPGFHAQAGSQVSAYITTDNSFCDMLPQALVAVNPIVEKSVDSDNALIEPINAFDEKQVKVYPNPNNGVFTIELTNFDRRTEIIIVNMLGKVVHRVENAGNNQMGISIPFIQKGIYSIVVSDGHTLETRKMVIH
ncbi:MAG: fibronectin type III domain-containing protein [Prolixibacteraceae bacterium]|nr:fibronectin type III domain-containing protein [Prolixibacteraceae bacterium]